MQLLTLVAYVISFPILMMEVRIHQLAETRLLGKHLRMSFAQNQTRELWQGFMPKRATITNTVDADLYSVEVYPGVDFFSRFDPTRAFEKWAAVRVADFAEVPEGMDTLVIPAGQYAVFQYQGRPSEAQQAYQYIYGSWLPGSAYQLDDRPHFALMGEGYKGEDPDSEEELWIPVMEKD